jgi:hypothetical protein
MKTMPREFWTHGVPKESYRDSGTRNFSRQNTVESERIDSKVKDSIGK